MSRKVQIIIVLLCVTGAGALVGFARFWPKAPPPLEDKYQGRFELFGYEPPQGMQGDNPLDRKQRWIYEFRADHIFRLRIYVDGGWELARRSGTVKSFPFTAPAGLFTIDIARDEAGPQLDHDTLHGLTLADWPVTVSAVSWSRLASSFSFS